jgi:hypothetical protein
MLLILYLQFRFVDSLSLQNLFIIFILLGMGVVFYVKEKYRRLHFYGQSLAEKKVDDWQDLINKHIASPLMVIGFKQQ